MESFATSLEGLLTSEEEEARKRVGKLSHENLLLPSVFYKTNPWPVLFAEKSSASVASAILANAGS